MKRGNFVLFSVSVILILSLSLVSASWFNDFWNRITGQAAIVSDYMDGTTQKGTCSGTPTACEEFRTQNSCGVQSGCTWEIAKEETMTASAIAGTCLGIPTDCTEFVTQSSCIVQSGCVWSEGTSVESPTIVCTDSDGGRDYFVRGLTSNSSNTFRDGCINGINNVKEFYCKPDPDGKIYSENYTCLNGCADGACVKDYNLSISIFLSKDAFRAGRQITVK